MKKNDKALLTKIPRCSKPIPMDINSIHCSILVIDDDPEIRECIVFALQEDGIGAQHAGDFHSGLAAARKFNPKVILLDYLMTNPIQPAEVALLRVAAGDPKVILMTASREHDALEHLGVDSLLLKPFDVENLLRAVVFKGNGVS